MVSVSEPQMLATVVNKNCYFGKRISLVDHMARMKTVSQVKQHCAFVSCFFGFCFFLSVVCQHSLRPRLTSRRGGGVTHRTAGLV